MGIQHYTAWEKVAIITDVGWVGNINIFWPYNTRTGESIQ